jgi:anti-sigma B factor antagonist
MTFSADVRRSTDQATLSLVGDLNALAKDSFEAAAERALAGPPSEIVLDFTGTSFVNSTGIAFIVSFLRRARALRVLVIARGLDDHHRHIFTITRLSDFMQIEEPDEAPSKSNANSKAGGSYA